MVSLRAFSLPRCRAVRLSYSIYACFAIIYLIFFHITDEPLHTDSIYAFSFHATPASATLRAAPRRRRESHARRSVSAGQGGRREECYTNARAPFRHCFPAAAATGDIVPRRAPGGMPSRDTLPRRCCRERRHCTQVFVARVTFTPRPPDTETLRRATC